MVTKPKTIKKVEDIEIEEVLSEPLQAAQIVDIAHVFRAVSLSGMIIEEGAQPASIVEDHLRQNYFSQGWDLYKVEHIRTIHGEGDVPMGEQMLYVLVKYAQ